MAVGVEVAAGKLVGVAEGVLVGVLVGVLGAMQPISSGLPASQSLVGSPSAAHGTDQVCSQFRPVGHRRQATAGVFVDVLVGVMVGVAVGVAVALLG